LILKRIVNFDLVVTNEAIASLFHSTETTKNGLYFRGRAFTADKDTQTGSIEVVRLRLYHVCRGSQQSAGAIKLKGQRIGTVAVTKGSDVSLIGAPSNPNCRLRWEPGRTM
jgi:hypothetical protein